MTDTRTSAFVLRTRPYGESDLIATLLTQDCGKLGGIAKGARRSRRRFAGGALQPFQHVQVRFSLGREHSLVLLHDARVVESYQVVGGDLIGYAWASYISELAEAMTPERDPCPDLFALYRGTVASIAGGNKAEPVAHHFILGLLGHAGWRPDFTTCGICSEPVTAYTRPVLDPRGSGIVCSRHEAESRGVDPFDPSFRPSRRVLDAPLLEYVRQAEKSMVFDCDSQVIETATALLDRLVDLHLGRPLKSRDFIKTLSHEI
ncbi:MAG: DNA repair protein RecO [Candidatus Binatia bacterium]